MPGQEVTSSVIWALGVRVSVGLVMVAPCVSDLSQKGNDRARAGRFTRGNWS
jgi:hypothetical protein